MDDNERSAIRQLREEQRASAAIDPGPAGSEKRGGPFRALIIITVVVLGVIAVAAAATPCFFYKLRVIMSAGEQREQAIALTCEQGDRGCRCWLPFTGLGCYTACGAAAPSPRLDCGMICLEGDF